MKKQTSVRSVKLLSLAIAATVTIIFGANTSASAQDKPKFNVGDRIECRTSGGGNYWYKGNIVPFQDGDYYNGNAPDSGYFYRVKLDGSSNSTFCKTEQMRPLAGTNPVNTTKADPNAGNQPGIDPPAPDKNGTVACPSSVPDPNGKGGLETSFIGAIRRDYEKEADPGQDGQVTVTIQKISIGQAHPFRAYVDPNEARGKTVYPIRATFTACTDYRTRISLHKEERSFACYKNTAGEWVCDVFAVAGDGLKDETKSIDKPKQ